MVICFWRDVFVKKKSGDSRNLQRFKKSPGISSAEVGNPRHESHDPYATAADMSFIAGFEFFVAHYPAIT